jgi:enoyl-CoA hydratase/carnithine racemase
MAQPATSGAVTLSRQGSIVTVTLSHPGRLNAISAAMWELLTRHFTWLADDETVGCVVLRGAEGHFSAGADITEFPKLRADLETVFHFHQRILAPALRAIRDCPHPTLAAIQGACIGGGLEIACCCDLRIAAASARLGAPIRDLGFPMAPEEMQAVYTAAGRNVTLELLLEGRILSADEALRKNVLTRVVADGEWEAEVVRSAENIAAGSPAVARLNKETIRRLATEPARFNEAELRAFYASWANSADHREGVQAFLEKRRPAWTQNAT